MTDVTGPVLFARYAYPPNALGFCGPDEPGAMLEMAADPGARRDLAHVASLFEGAWPYLQLIAACNGIADPLDRRVVQAYWTGNELLGGVPAGVLSRSLADRFGHRVGRQLGPLLSASWAGVPHHSLHVFAVYPWLGLLRAGRAAPSLEVLDQCRIRSGTICSVDGATVTVRDRPLVFDGSRLRLGHPRLATARRSLGGLGSVPDVVPGDLVSLHWNWVCDRLSLREAAWLSRCTRRNLEAVNASAAPGPAAALDFG